MTVVALRNVSPGVVTGGLAPSGPVRPNRLVGSRVRCQNVSRQGLTLRVKISPALLGRVLGKGHSISARCTLLFRTTLNVSTRI